MQYLIIINREAREIMYLVASVGPFVCLSELSCLNRLTFDSQIWSEGWSLPVQGFVCLSVISVACADNLADAVDQLLIHFIIPTT